MLVSVWQCTQISIIYITHKYAACLYLHDKNYVHTFFSYIFSLSLSIISIQCVWRSYDNILRFLLRWWVGFYFLLKFFFFYIWGWCTRWRKWKFNRIFITLHIHTHNPIHNFLFNDLRLSLVCMSGKSRHTHTHKESEQVKKRVIKYFFFIRYEGDWI